jgi:hypothetical protein
MTKQAETEVNQTGETPATNPPGRPVTSPGTSLSPDPNDIEADSDTFKRYKDYIRYERAWFGLEAET